MSQVLLVCAINLLLTEAAAAADMLESLSGRAGGIAVTVVVVAEGEANSKRGCFKGVAGIDRGFATRFFLRLGVGEATEDDVSSVSVGY